MVINFPSKNIRLVIAKLSKNHCIFHFREATACWIAVNANYGFIQVFI